MPSIPQDTLDLLRLTLTPGLGPVLISRAIDLFGSPGAVLAASETTLRRVKGIGDDRARAIAKGIESSQTATDDELALADTLGVDILARTDPAYPPLLAQINDAPPILYIKGRIDHAQLDRYTVGIVGSRSCTQYGTEQAERFAAALAQSGLTIVSGGARGIDTAAHRAALRIKGRTIAVLGCGLNDCYPPDNRELFDRIVAGSGAVISELPLRTPPNAENFPARNRIISGLSLGTLVVEAAKRSGALITARLAAEDHGREVFALPARVDSASAAGSLELIKSGGAQMVTHPDDLLAALESPARHLHHGTHEARYAGASAPDLFDHDDATSATPAPTASMRDTGLSVTQLAVLTALDKPRGMDELAAVLNTPAHTLRADITMLEIKRRVRRRGTLLERVDA